MFYVIIFSRRIIITTPNFSSIFVIIQKISRFFGVKNYENVTITKLTKKSLRGLLEKHYSEQKNPVLHGVIGALYEDSINACVLLGQRNLNQVEVAGTLGETISKKDADWIKSIYK